MTYLDPTDAAGAALLDSRLLPVFPEGAERVATGA